MEYFMMAEIILNFPIVIFKGMSIQILQYHATCSLFLTLPILKQTYDKLSWVIVNVFVVFCRFNIFFYWWMPHSKTLRSYRDAIIAWEGLQIVPWQLRPLCRERGTYIMPHSWPLYLQCDFCRVCLQSENDRPNLVYYQQGD